MKHITEISLDIIARFCCVSFSLAQHTERLSASPYSLGRNKTEALLPGGMRWNLFSRGSIDAATENGTIDGEDFHQSATMRTRDEEHSPSLFLLLPIFL